MQPNDLLRKQLLKRERLDDLDSTGWNEKSRPVGAANSAKLPVAAGQATPWVLNHCKALAKPSAASSLR